MKTTDHLGLLRAGPQEWNRHRAVTGEAPALVEEDLRGIDLEGADLTGGSFFRCDLRSARLAGAKLCGTHLTEADLSDANLEGANLEGAIGTKANFLSAGFGGARMAGVAFDGAQLTGADLRGALFSARTNFSGADLSTARLEGVDLSGANLAYAELRLTRFTDANLRDAKLVETVLSGADLRQADLSGADLTGATFIRTKVEGARFTGARIYGISVWDLDGVPADENGLIVTPRHDPKITVGDLDVAQFVYLLLDNAKLRSVIDTVTAKTVLILGRFSEERKEILDAIRDHVSSENYVPIIFDFDKPAQRDLTETVRTLAHLARFIIADITDPKSIPQELTTIIPQLPSVPVQPILLSGRREWAMFGDLKRTGRVLETFVYEDLADVTANLRAKILRPAERWLELFSKITDPFAEIERLREELARQQS